MLHTGSGLPAIRQKYRSSFVRGLRSDAREFNSSDPESIIYNFERQPSLYSKPSALSEYVKAVVSREMQTRGNRVSSHALLLLATVIFCHAKQGTICLRLISTWMDIVCRRNW
jgi:hypothetical protein